MKANVPSFRRMAALWVAMASVLLVACAGGGGGGGGGGEESDAAGAGQPSVVTNSATIPPGSTCPNGGITVETGIDENGNGVLDPAEVDTTQTICNGADATNFMVVTSDEPVGQNCPLGGVKVQAWEDSNSNGIPDAGEVAQTYYVCAGGLAGTLYAADITGSLYTIDPSTGIAIYLTAIEHDNCGECTTAPIGEVSAMAYDPDTRTLFAGTGPTVAVDHLRGSIFAVDPAISWSVLLSNGAFTGYDQIDGMAVGADHTVFAVVEGVEVPPTLITVDRFTGEPFAVEIAPGVGLGVFGAGHGLTFDDSGTTLYLADGADLAEIDTANGTVLSTTPLTYLRFPLSFCSPPAIISMAAVGGGVAYAIVHDDRTICLQADLRYLAQVNLATGEVTNFGETLSDLDGLVFAPNPMLPSRVVHLANNGVSRGLPIGFTFNFYGNDYVQFYVSSNGFIGFSPGMSDGCCQGGVIPDGGVPNNIIALAWNELDPSSGGTISYETTGTAPNRQLAVSYDSVPSGCLLDGLVTTQAILHEGSGIIEINTTSQDPDLECQTFTQGLENEDGTVAAYVPGRVAADYGLVDDLVIFTPDGEGDYIVNVNGNTVPLANAGPDASVAAGSLAVLNGTGSSDLDGNPLTYSWTWVSHPGTAPGLSGPVHSPQFVPVLVGVYVLRLVVNDGDLDSEPDTVTVTAFDGTAPTVVSTNPANGNTTTGGSWYLSTFGISVTFSEDMSTTATGAAGVISLGCGAATTTLFNPIWSGGAGSTTVSLNGTAWVPSPPNAGDTCSISVSTAAVDLAGNAFAGGIVSSWVLVP